MDHTHAAAQHVARAPHLQAPATSSASSKPLHDMMAKELFMLLLQASVMVACMYVIVICFGRAMLAHSETGAHPSNL